MCARPETREPYMRPTVSSERKLPTGKNRFGASHSQSSLELFRPQHRGQQVTKDQHTHEKQQGVDQHQGPPTSSDRRPPRKRCPAKRKRSSGPRTLRHAFHALQYVGRVPSRDPPLVIRTSRGLPSQSSTALCADQD